MPRRTKKDKRKLSPKEYAVAIGKVAHTTYKAAPLAIIVQVIGAVITSVLPIITIYYAALTTTALAEAFAGNEQAGSQAIWYVIVTAILGIVMTTWTTVESYVSQLMRYRVESAMTNRMYEHFLNLDFWRYDDKTTADTYDKARRFAQFFPYIFDRLTKVLTDFITMVSGVIALIIVSWWLGLIALVAIIPGLIIQFRLSRAQTRHWNENVESSRKIGMIEWSLLEPRYMSELRLYGMVRYIIGLRQKLRDKVEKERIEFERKYIGKKLAADVLEAAAQVVALVWVTIQIIHRAQPIGQFIYVQQVVSRAIGGANSFVSSVSAIDEDIANLFDYQEFMNFPSIEKGHKKLLEAPAVLRLENISFHYPTSDVDVLKNVTMTIKAKQHVAIVGENGAGKSTLIKILTGLYAPSRGKMLLDDKDLTAIDVTSWHRQISVLQQDFLAYGFATARENIHFGDTSEVLNNDRFESALDRAEARDFLEKLPRGVDSYVNQWMEDDEGNNGTNLSGGQWQRLALARNFYRNSPIIILDEPTSAIDALAESRIFKHLFADKERTVITISHRLTTIKKADVIFMMKSGKLVERGTYEELVKKKAEFYTMFQSQIEK
ncbi:MAG TPA: ABC transporter ATP-binding protein [Candidatus Saccharimonadales bacterium]